MQENIESQPVLPGVLNQPNEPQTGVRPAGLAPWLLALYEAPLDNIGASHHRSWGHIAAGSAFIFILTELLFFLSERSYNRADLSFTLGQLILWLAWPAMVWLTLGYIESETKRKIKDFYEFSLVLAVLVELPLVLPIVFVQFALGPGSLFGSLLIFGTAMFTVPLLAAAVAIGLQSRFAVSKLYAWLIAIATQFIMFWYFVIIAIGS